MLVITREHEENAVCAADVVNIQCRRSIGAVSCRDQHALATDNGLLDGGFHVVTGYVPQFLTIFVQQAEAFGIAGWQIPGGVFVAVDTVDRVSAKVRDLIDASVALYKLLSRDHRQANEQNRNNKQYRITYHYGTRAQKDTFLGSNPKYG